MPRIPAKLYSFCIVAIFAFLFSSAQNDTARNRMIIAPVNKVITNLNLPKLYGWVDMHTHPASQWGFGEQLFYGDNDGPPNLALGSCNCYHNFVAWPFDGNCGQQN